MPEQLAPTQMVNREIERFLEDGEPGVICIRGRWGVGKTYAWNQALNAVANRGGLKLQKYSYVSLFGVTSLEQLKYQIFQNRTEGKQIVQPADFQTAVNSWSQLLDKGLTTGLELLGAKGVGEVVQAGAFLSISKQVVCIDDIERKGKDLRTMDILGLVSLLREQRGCKVVLILQR